MGCYESINKIIKNNTHSKYYYNNDKNNNNFKNYSKNNNYKHRNYYDNQVGRRKNTTNVKVLVNISINVNIVEDNMNLTNTYVQHLIKYATYVRRKVILIYSAYQEIVI